MYTTSFIRNALVKGASALAISLVILSGTGCRRNTSTDTNDIQPTTEVSTICTTTTTTSTTTTSSTTTTTTTSGTTTTATTTMRIVEEPIVTEQTIAWENIQATEPYIEPVYIEPVQSVEPVINTDYGITDYERTLLRNVVANEYGSDYVSVAEKAKVVAVVMNRVNNPQFPNTIEGVLTQPSQFSGYYATNYEWNKVTDSVREAVDYYFNHQDEYGNWLYFSGDGTWNYFR